MNAPLDFPNAPSDGQLFTGPNGVTYEWSAARDLWMQVAAGIAVGGSPPIFEDSRAGVYIVGNVNLSTDVLPLATQGARLFRRVFTAIDPANQIDVDCDAVFWSSGTAISLMLMLFIDDQCVASKVVTTSANWAAPLRLRWRGHRSAGPHTYDVRWSPQAGYGGNVGRGDGGRLLGGSVNHLLTITEITTGRKGPRGDKGPPGDGNTILQTAYKQSIITGALAGGAVSTQNGQPFPVTSGNALDSITIDLQRADSTVEIDAAFKGGPSTADEYFFALFHGETFVDGTIQMLHTGNSVIVPFKTILPSPGAGPLTLDFRVGSNSGGAWRPNAQAGSALPSPNKSWITVRETMATRMEA